MFRIGGNTFYNRKNKILMKIPEIKRSRIRLIAELSGIPNEFPCQVYRAEQLTTSICKCHRFPCYLLLLFGLKNILMRKPTAATTHFNSHSITYQTNIDFFFLLQANRAYGTEISPRSFVISFVILLYAISYNIFI